MEAATPCAISDIDSHFHTSLAHLNPWKMDRDGCVGEQRSVCGPLLHIF